MKYQIYNLDNNRDKMFRGWDEVEDDFSMDDYRCVYSGTISEEEAGTSNPAEVLEVLYMKFNSGRRPKDFKGHSMSTSDVVELDGELYYCDYFGFKKLK